MENDINLDTRPEFHRVHVRASMNGLVAKSTGSQLSSRMLSMKEANGLLKLPMKSPEQSRLQKGTKVQCMLIGQLDPQ